MEPDEMAAGELEDLNGGTAGQPAPPAGPSALTVAPHASTTSTGELTTAMQAALIAGTGVFAIAVLIPLCTLLWWAMAIGVIAIAGTALLHTGGLESSTLGVSMVVAAVVVVPMLMLAAVERKALADGEIVPSQWGDRNPVWRRCAWLLAAAALTTLAASPHSPYFPHPVATMAVLAAAGFVIVVSAVAAINATNAAAHALYRFGNRGRYLAGFLTAAMLLLGAGGAWAHREGWTRRPWRVVAAEAELRKVDRPHGALDAGMKMLCLGAGETEPALARDGDAAPGCRFLPGASGDTDAADDCFTALMPSVPAVKNLLRGRDYRLNEFDADDVAMEALLATCGADPPRDNPRAYLFAVAKNQGRRAIVAARRRVSCEELNDATKPATICSPSGAADPRTDAEQAERDVALALLWEQTLCTVDEPTARIVRSRLVDDLSFREAGRRARMTEVQARDKFHNAIRKVRQLGLADCFRE